MLFRRMPMQWACFECHKVFKKQEHDPATALPCPQCAEPMTMMGSAFRAPKSGNAEQWAKAQQLVQNGFLFGRNAGPRPAHLKDVPEFLEKQAQKRMTPGEKLLKGAKDLPRPTAPVKRENHDGRITYSLAGSPLVPYDEVEVMAEGEWVRGTFRVTGNGGRRVEPHVKARGGRIIFLETNMACRRPKLG